MRQIVHIPQNFTPETDIVGYNKRHKDKYLWVVHSIVFGKFLNYKSEYGGVNLNMELLQKFLGSNYTIKVINQLVESKVIEVGKNYQPDVFSKAYRLTPKFSSAKIEPRYLDKKTYSKKLQRFREQHLRDVIRGNPNILHEFNNLTRLRIDREEAEAYIEAHYYKNTDQYNSRMLAVHYLDQLHKADFRDGVYKIDFFFKVKGGRVYSPYTSCPKDLEQFLYFPKYGRLIEADAKNSQLVFANKLLNRESQSIDNQVFISNLNNIKEKVIEKRGFGEVAQIYDPKNPYLNLPSTSPLYVIHFRLNHLISNGWDSVISEGMAYEVMMHLTKFNGKTLGHKKHDRDEFKEVFFGNLFYNKFNVNRMTQMEKTFFEFFPDEAIKLFTAKTMYGNGGFAIKVQELEGNLFHHQIVGLMRRKFKSIPFVIKHDSIKFPITYADELLPLLDEILKTSLDDNRLTFKITY